MQQKVIDTFQELPSQDPEKSYCQNGKYRPCDSHTNRHQAVITQAVAAAIAAMAVLLYTCTPTSVKKR